MSQEYSNPTRADDPHALPDVEIYYMDKGDSVDEYGDTLEAGYYYWYCFPGCMPDSDPIGPFATYADALADCRENTEEE